ncbi:hypothetical protein BMS3Bbin04_01001 [bacterium BMS3Bbin04]|nr:hypothetical protein BMS3Bbin04_01001 [bacterium BMS3Bbin04]
MNMKAVIFVVVVVAIAAAIYFIPNGDELQNQQTAPIRSGSVSPANDGHAHSALPEIDSLKVSIQDSTGTELAVMTLIPHSFQPLPGTEYSLHLTDFYTHLIMEEGDPVNASPHPENPAARIEIHKDDVVVDYGWAFQNMPYFRMSGMGGAYDHEETGLTFALLETYGLEIPEAATHNP